MFPEHEGCTRSPDGLQGPLAPAYEVRSFLSLWMGSRVLTVGFQRNNDLQIRPGALPAGRLLESAPDPLRTGGLSMMPCLQPLPLWSLGEGQSGTRGLGWRHGQADSATGWALGGKISPSSSQYDLQAPSPNTQPALSSWLPTNTCVACIRGDKQRADQPRTASGAEVPSGCPGELWGR